MQAKIATLGSVWKYISDDVLWVVKTLDPNCYKGTHELNSRLEIDVRSINNNVPGRMTLVSHTHQIVYDTCWEYMGHICPDCQKLCNQHCFF